MGIAYQEHRAFVDMSKAFRQFQKADAAFADGKDDSAVNHLAEGLDYLQTSLDHLAKAGDDRLDKAADEIDKGNNELQKSLEAYNDGDDDSAEKHYAKALDRYDAALDLFD